MIARSKRHEPRKRAEKSTLSVGDKWLAIPRTSNSTPSEHGLLGCDRATNGSAFTTSKEDWLGVRDERMRLEEPQRSLKVGDSEGTRRDAYLRLPRLSPRTRDERGR